MTTAKGYDWECEECGAHIGKTSRSAQFERDLYTFTGTREQYERFQDDIDQDDDGCYHCCGTCGFGGSRPDIYHHKKKKGMHHDHQKKTMAKNSGAGTVPHPGVQ